MDENTAQKAKLEAKRRSKSVSRMIADFIESIESKNISEKELPPTTSKQHQNLLVF